MDHTNPNESQDNDGANGNGGRRVITEITETYIISGPGQSVFATMQNMMNRLVNANASFSPPEQQPPPAPMTQHADGTASEGVSAHTPRPNTGNTTDDLPSYVGDGQWTFSRSPPSDANQMPGIEPLPPVSPPNADGPSPPPNSRPIRPLPRNGVRPSQTPLSHFHAHTANGTIDLFAFSVTPGETLPPPPPDSQPLPFTFELGTDALAGFQAFLMGMPNMEKEREPDVGRARVLLHGMEAVPNGLVRRFELAGGVPGGHGTEESSASGCAVCWGPLLDEVEAGEWDTALHAKEPEKSPEKEDKKSDDSDELRGRIVALPCAHVYHAECLLPWFSRQTTCPTCRFDIDPDSLTWNPRPPPQPPAGEGPQSQSNPDDQNTADAARFFQFLNSPFLLRPLRPTSTAPTSTAPQNQPASGPQTQPQPESQAPPESQSRPQPQFPQQQQQPPQPQTQPQFHNAFLPFLFQHGFHFPNPEPPSQSPTSTASPDSEQNPHPPDSESPTTTSSTTPPPPVPPASSDQTRAGSPPNIQGQHNNPQFRGVFPFPMYFFRRGDGVPRPHTASQPPHERRKWISPDPIGKTLRQRVEQKERELGFRCDNAVCLVAPTDEDPLHLSEHAADRVRIGAAYDARGRACRHVFHPGCLVTSARVAGVQATEGESDVGVQCPVCRADGTLTCTEWNEGVRAAEAEVVS